MTKITFLIPNLILNRFTFNNFKNKSIFSILKMQVFTEEAERNTAKRQKKNTYGP